jgi:hypothetical protein
VWRYFDRICLLRLYVVRFESIRTVSRLNNTYLRFRGRLCILNFSTYRAMHLQIHRDAVTEDIAPTCVKIHKEICIHKTSHSSNL